MPGTDFIIHLDAPDLQDAICGGKVSCLSRLLTAGYRVPRGVCVTTEAFTAHVETSGLRERIARELYRKGYNDMRWEELWDAGLRIRSMFLDTPISASLADHLMTGLDSFFADRPVAVRSSAPGEDSERSSFAGLHESFLNIRGAPAIVEHIRLVWASLFSDSALLYRRELGLDVEHSTMAVLIQEQIMSDVSGVIFTRSPQLHNQAVIEAVHGLNEGLVSAAVEPDRWVLERDSGKILSHQAPQRMQIMIPAEDGTRLESLQIEDRETPPLDEPDVRRVYTLGMNAEHFFGPPQDVEWTFQDGTLHVLQSRPITTTPTGERQRHVGLKGSLQFLQTLREKIENQLIPRMQEIAAGLATQDLTTLSDRDLARTLTERADTRQQWRDTYRREFIPYAHGMRLFGKYYNDLLRPADPYEFMDLLISGDLESLKRNRLLTDMAALVRQDSTLLSHLCSGGSPHDHALLDSALQDYLARYGNLACGENHCADEQSVIRLICALAAAAPTEPAAADTVQRTHTFLNSLPADEHRFAADLLDLARSSYRLRDDDNIHLGRIEGELLRAEQEAGRRILARGTMDPAGLDCTQLYEALRNEFWRPPPPPSSPTPQDLPFIRHPRQLTGQPAGQGLASGPARVIHRAAELAAFRAGEVLVCDALEPGMTFVAPLCSAIVERRGGMLIHGAIIAREYGLPCVTGIPQATELIHTGDQLTVDGYLGIVVLTSLSTAS